MAGFSHIAPLKRALYERLAAITGTGEALEGVQVSYGFPWNEELAREAVVCGNTRADDPTGGDGGQRAAALGNRRREERFVLQLDVLVQRPETQIFVTERAFAIGADIEESLRAWGEESPSFGGFTRWAQVTAVWHEEGGDADRRQCSVHIDIACAERI